MNWYKKAQLDPNAWEFHDNTHRLREDLPFVTVPYGGPGTMARMPQERKPREQLEERYYGVHVSQSPEVAAIYANGISNKQDPPIILEITTSKGWENDIDAQKSFALTFVEELSDPTLTFLDYNIPQKIKEEGLSKDTILDIMIDISNLDYYDEDDSSGDFSISDIILRNKKRQAYSSIVDYFENYYGDKQEEMFYKKFILPIFYKQGELDDRLRGWIINQMRIMDVIPQEEITAIYTFEPYSEKINMHGEEPDADEEGRIIYNYEDLDYGAPKMIEIWRNKNPQLIPQVFDTFYHGTNLNRAKQAYPQMSGILEKAKG